MTNVQISGEDECMRCGHNRRSHTFGATVGCVVVVRDYRLSPNTPCPCEGFTESWQPPTPRPDDDEDDGHFQPGDWVMVPMQVTRDQGGVHSEDIRLTTRSHNADEYIVVRRDYVQDGEAPAHADPCTAIARAINTSGTKFVICTKHRGHAGWHQSGEQAWQDGQTIGHFEAKS